MGKLAKLQKAIESAMKLSAVHNTTARGVRAASNLGGIPAPSHAVVRADQPFDAFGDISLIAKRDMVDPKSGQRLYAADVYSRRQPKPLFRTSRKITSPEALEIKRHMEAFGDSRRWEFLDWIESGDPRDIGRLSSSKGALVAYAKANGLDVPVANTDSAYDVLKRVESAGVDPYGVSDWLQSSLVENGDWSNPYFLRGRKKVDYTLENLTDYMTAKTKGEEQTLVESLGKQRSKSVRQYKSIDEARADYERLLSKEDFKKFSEETNNDLFNLAERVESEYSSSFQKLDDLSAAVGDVMRGVDPDIALRRHDLTGDVGDELKALADKVKNGPTEYFESKFRGAARLSDYAGAVVPEGTPQDVIDTLKANGLQVETYADEAGRLAARKKIPGSAFMLPLGVSAVALMGSENADAAEAQQSATMPLEEVRAAGERFRHMREQKRGFWNNLKGLGETALTLGSGLAGGIVADASRLGGYLNPFMSVEDTEVGANAIANALQYQPSNAAIKYLGPIGAAAEGAVQDVERGVDRLNVEDSIPYKAYQALPERAQGVVRIGADYLF